jgi:hypothetical protein
VRINVDVIVGRGTLGPLAAKRGHLDHSNRHGRLRRPAGERACRQSGATRR